MAYLYVFAPVFGPAAVLAHDGEPGRSKLMTWYKVCHQVATSQILFWFLKTCGQCAVMYTRAARTIPCIECERGAGFIFDPMSYMSGLAGGEIERTRF